MAAREKDENENRRKDMNDHAGVTFEIGIGREVDKPRSAPPKRLRNYQRKTVTREELEQKQLEAETRRQEREKEMLRRVQQSREEVEKLNKNFSALLEQDAKRQGATGTTSTPSLSPQQLKDKFRSVNKDYQKMVKSIGSTVRLPE